MNTQAPLAIDAAKYRVLRKELIEQHGLSDDDQALLDTLDGSTDIMDQLAEMMRCSRKLALFIEKNKLEIKQLSDRNYALEGKIEQLRRIVIYYLGFIGRKRIEAPDFTYTLANGRPSLVGAADPEKLPDRFVRVKRSENRSAILEALKSGEIVEGYAISNGQPHLRSV